MRSALVITLLSLFPSLGHAGGDPLSLGARFTGMGGTGLTLTDLWSVRLNPAGIAGLESTVAGLSYQRHFLSEELAQQGMAVVLPVGKGAFGVAADRFGYDLYNETRASLAYAMRFGDGLRAAIQLDHLGVRIGENYGSTGTVVAEFGVQAALTEALWIGAHLYNPTRSVLVKRSEGAVDIDERVPTVLKAGLGYTFNAKLVMTGEVEKDLDRPERFRFGMEYVPMDALRLRMGISSGPVQAHFGAGFRVKQLDIDLAVAVRSQLGATPMLTLNYRFK